MIELPGSFSGNDDLADAAARAADASQRTSLAIFMSATASVFSAPCALDDRVVAGERFEFVRRGHERQAGELGDLRRDRLGIFRVRVEAGADRRAAERQLVRCRQRRFDRARRA